MPSIDDKEDMQFADEAYDILGFTKEEKYNVYKVSHLFSPLICPWAILTLPDISICPVLRITKDPLSAWHLRLSSANGWDRGRRGLLSDRGTLLWYLGATRLNRLTQH